MSHQYLTRSPIYGYLPTPPLGQNMTQGQGPVCTINKRKKSGNRLFDQDGHQDSSSASL